MMILPLADALQNCLQNLTSRIAGIDNEQMSNRVMGMGAMLGFGATAIKEQFKTPSSNINSSNVGNSNNGLKGFINRAKSVVNPGLNLSDEKDYNGNINPIRNVIPTEKSTINNNSINKTNANNSTNNGFSAKSVASKVVKTGVNATKTYWQVGKQMAEGNINNFSFKNNRNNNIQTKKNYQDTEYLNNVAQNNYSKETGDENELNKQG